MVGLLQPEGESQNPLFFMPKPVFLAVWATYTRLKTGSSCSPDSLPTAVPIHTLRFQEEASPFVSHRHGCQGNFR